MSSPAENSYLPVKIDTRKRPPGASGFVRTGQATLVRAAQLVGVAQPPARLTSMAVFVKAAPD